MKLKFPNISPNFAAPSFRDIPCQPFVFRPINLRLTNSWALPLITLPYGFFHFQSFRNYILLDLLCKYNLLSSKSPIYNFRVILDEPQLVIYSFNLRDRTVNNCFFVGFRKQNQNSKKEK